jgi:hypothetical protein
MLPSSEPKPQPETERRAANIRQPKVETTPGDDSSVFFMVVTRLE